MFRCPYCEGNINPGNIVRDRQGGIVRKPVVVYACPHCKKVLSVGAW